MMSSSLICFCIRALCSVVSVDVVVGVGCVEFSDDLVSFPTIPYPVVDSLPEQMDSLSHWYLCTADLVSGP